MSALEEMLRRIAAVSRTGGGSISPGVLWLCKGLEAGSGALGHEIARELRPGAPCGVLSGPSFAQEVARGQATALVAASSDERLLLRSGPFTGTYKIGCGSSGVTPVGAW